MSTTSKTFAGWARRTYRFNNSYKADDEHEYVGEFRVIRHVIVKNDDYEMADGSIFTVKAPRGVSRADVVNVLTNTFSRNCRCEHDCCGCVQSGVSNVRRAKRREWRVEVLRRYNV